MCPICANFVDAKARMWCERMTTETGGDNRVVRILKLIGTALLAAVFAGIFLPIGTFFIAMIVANLTSSCGAGSSGGCEMWAGSVAIFSIPVWALIAFALGIYGGLKQP
jgi:hypothetical protein